jgi:glutamate racemase
MNNKPIGVFDSGVGGLTVVREIKRLLPNETIVYLGDTANLPYGDKSEEIVRSYSKANTEFLLKFDIKVLVAACNTASSVALTFLKEHYNIPIVGVIEPAAKGAIYATRNGKIGVIGTNRTIRSNVYAQTLEKMNPDLSVKQKPCPLFVPLIEENFVDHPATKLIAEEYLKEFRESGVDTLILGCTHYPLIINVMREILPNVKLVDSALFTAQDLKDVLASNYMLCEGSDNPEHRFFATDITDKLDILARRILQNGTHFEEVSLPATPSHPPAPAMERQPPAPLC